MSTFKEQAGTYVTFCVGKMFYNSIINFLKSPGR